MNTVTYKLTAGNWSVSSADDPKTELVELDTAVSLFSPGDYGRVAVYAPPPPKQSLLQQVAGAALSAAGSALGIGGPPGGADDTFAIEVRGQKVKLGDRMTVELAVDGKAATVLTAAIVSIESGFDRTTLTGRSDMHKLANARLNAIYQSQTLGQIVDDLCSQTGVTAGEVEDGNTYPYFVVHESQNVLANIRALARREGRDVYFDSDDRLTIKKFAKTSADHTLYFGIDLLDVRVQNNQPGGDHVVVSGESPSSGQGTDTWAWLAKDVSVCASEVGSGSRTLAIRDPALRTKDAVAAAATARLGALKDQAALGRLTILGRPTLKLGDAIELKNVPKPEMNGLFRVTAVRHTYNKHMGFVTVADFSGQGGAAKAQDLLGKLGAALSSVAGGVGL